MAQDNWRGKIAAAYRKAGFGEAAYQQRLARMGYQQGGRWVNMGCEPLRTNQHILHLLLTVFTAGLWAPVWIVRAVQGNKQMVWQPERPPWPEGWQPDASPASPPRP